VIFSGLWLRVGIAAALVMAGLAMYHFTYIRGYNARAAEFQSEVVKASLLAVEEFKANVKDAETANLKIIETLAAENVRQEGIAVTLRKRLAAQANLPRNCNETPLLGQSVLDPYSLRLLNDARRAATRDRPGVDPRAAGRGDAPGGASAAASGPVTGGEFADNDLEVVRLYKELAARHDALVDWVEQTLRKP
jgi:hypothetical protein